MKIKKMFLTKRVFKPLAIICSMFLIGTIAFFADGPTDEPMPCTANAVNIELVGAVSPAGGVTIQYIESIQVLDGNPNEIVFISQNIGASCGWGTPAAAWKMILDPDTGLMTGVEFKQKLNLIQNGRTSLFERSDGTLFTGGGWCGYKPPYYSTDDGETWQRADAGPVHPPNSTFSYAELKGSVYAGTGYEPWHGQVYRWLGGGNWQLVLDIPPPRSIVSSMIDYKDQLFVGSYVYWWSTSGCQYSTPVYVSSDGGTFNATTGIPPCYTITQLLTTGDQLLALADSHPKYYLYLWNDCTGVWEEISSFNKYDRMPWNQMVSNNGFLYIYGKAPGDAFAGIYRSKDMGASWNQIAVHEGPDVTTMHVHDGTIYMGTKSASGIAYIYRFRDTIEADVDIDPGNINLKSNGKWVTGYIELPGDYPAEDIDLATVAIAEINGNPVSPLYREGPADIGDHDLNDIPDLMVKFDRQALIGLFNNMNAEDGDEMVLAVSGNLTGGQSFEGSCTIRVIKKGKK
jgi:hypothetical protein